jgi:flap endonuclease GEN
MPWEKDLIDLSSPLPCAAHKTQTAQGMQLHRGEGRRALSNISENGNTLGASCYKHEEGSRGNYVQLEETLPLI